MPTADQSFLDVMDLAVRTSPWRLKRGEWHVQGKRKGDGALVCISTGNPLCFGTPKVPFGDEMVAAWGLIKSALPCAALLPAMPLPPLWPNYGPRFGVMMKFEYEKKWESPLRNGLGQFTKWQITLKRGLEQRHVSLVQGWGVQNGIAHLVLGSDKDVMTGKECWPPPGMA
jgi:hypothetical protein